MTPSLRTLTPADLARVSSLLRCHFVSGKVLHRAMQIVPDAWCGGDLDALGGAAERGCSLVAEHPIETGLLGCAVAFDITDAFAEVPAEAFYDANDPLAGLRHTLRRGAPLPEPGQTLHLDSAGQRLCRHLLGSRSGFRTPPRWHQWTHAHGLDGAVCLCPASVHVGPGRNGSDKRRATCRLCRVGCRVVPRADHDGARLPHVEQPDAPTRSARSPRFCSCCRCSR